MCWGLEGADVGRMCFGNILGGVDFIVHNNQNSFVSGSVIASYPQSTQIIINTVTAEFVGTAHGSC